MPDTRTGRPSRGDSADDDALADLVFGLESSSELVDDPDRLVAVGQFRPVLYLPLPYAPEILPKAGEFSPVRIVRGLFRDISSGTEPAYVHDEVTDMDSEARLVLDEGFERAVARVVDAFVCEGFIVRALDRGTLSRPAFHGGVLRYALIEAVLPEAPGDGRGSDFTPSTESGCRLGLVELTGSCTLVTAERPLVPHPLLVSPPRVAERVANALDLVMRRGSSLVAA